MTPCSFSTALDQVNAGRQAIKLAQGTYPGPFELSSMTVDIHGSESVIVGTGNMTTIRILDGATVRLSRLTISPQVSGGVDGVDCTVTNHFAPSSVTLDRVSAVGEIAVSGDGCNVAITRSHLAGSVVDLSTLDIPEAFVDQTLFDGAAVLAALATDTGILHVTNSVIVAHNQSDVALEGNLDISFSTLVMPPMTCNLSEAGCISPTTIGICIANSIVTTATLGATDTLLGTGCELSHSIVYPQTAALNGANNLLVDPMLVDPANGDFRLMPGSPAVDAADPSASDSVDFDGTARPQGARDDIGAFELVPSGG